MIERRDALGDARWMVHLGGDVGDRGADVKPLGACRHPGEEHLRGGLVRVVLQEVMLGRPVVFEADRIDRLGDLHLAQEARVLVIIEGGMHLREDSELHGATSLRSGCGGPKVSDSRHWGPQTCELLLRKNELAFEHSNCQSNCCMIRVATEDDVGNRTLQDKARQARNDLYRQHVLEAAEQVFAQRGFDSAKLQDISRLAGVSMGTIYAVFPGKEELFRAILAERGHELLEVARDGAQSDADPRAALDGLIAAYIDYFIAHPNFLRMHVRLGTSWVLGPTMGASGQVQLWAEIHAVQAALMSVASRPARSSTKTRPFSPRSSARSIKSCWPIGSPAA